MQCIAAQVVARSGARQRGASGNPPCCDGIPSWVKANRESKTRSGMGPLLGPVASVANSARRTHNETYLSEEGCGVHNDNTEDHEVVVEMYAGAVCAIEDEAVRLQVIK